MAADTHTQLGNPAENHGPQNGNHGAAGKTVDRLDSWKDIAGFFQRDIRTVQLWEKKEGLPVHRHGHKGHASVYAYAEELDAWLQTRARGREAARESQVEDPRIARRAIPARGWWTAAAIALVVLASVLLLRHEMQARRPDPPAARILAVLPFNSLASSQAAGTRNFLADGLTEAVITDLGRSGQVTVMSSRSTDPYRGRRDPARVVAQQLHATLILDGTVAQEGNTVRVTAQLLDAQEGRQLWAGTYSRSQTGVLALEDDIAAQMTKDVIHAVTGGPR